MLLILLGLAVIAFITALPMLVVLLTPEPPPRVGRRSPTDEPEARSTPRTQGRSRSGSLGA